jgi:hypothetical protein
LNQLVTVPGRVVFHAFGKDVSTKMENSFIGKVVGPTAI